MRIALFNAFPAAPFTAEKEFIKRCLSVLGKLGHEACEVSTSGDVLRVDPDFVLVTHDLVPKLTEHFTVGVLWSPTCFYKRDSERLKNIGSWDLVVPINELTREFAEDLQFSLGCRSDVSQEILYPSSPIFDIGMPNVKNLSLAYVGVHWDGARHERLFQELSKVVDLNVYGPPEAWEFIPEAYRGPIPFDGRAVVETLNRHGAVLAAHKKTHREEDTPCMRVFESCAAKCFVITDGMNSLRRLFGDSVEYVDLTTSAKDAAREVATIVNAARRDPEATARRIESAHKIFSKHASLEALLPPLVDEVRERIRRQRHIPIRVDSPAVSVIIRCGSRPLSTIKRAVQSLYRQLYPEISIIFASFAEIEGFTEYMDELRAGGRFGSITVARVGGDGRRSTSLWTGLRQVTTPFFAILDDDDEIFPDHLQHIMQAFEATPEADLIYSGAIRHEEEGALPDLHPRLRRADGSFVEEVRELVSFKQFDINSLLSWDNMILSHSFVARSGLLIAEVLQDPRLEVSEDVYLYLLLAARGARFQFNGRASVVWNWRSMSGDNSMIEFTTAKRLKSAERITRRLAGHTFPIAFRGQIVLGRGFPIGELSAAENDGGLSPCDNAYDATPEEGIDFKRHGMPTFIVDCTGVSYREDWGRWTDGDVAKFRFDRPLPARFDLELSGYVQAPNTGRDITVRVGSFKTAFRMTEPEPNARTVSMHLMNDDGSDTIFIEIPNPTSPSTTGSSTDKRRLGIALLSLKIKPPAAENEGGLSPYDDRCLRCDGDVPLDVEKRQAGVAD